jgi:hypothetical protein
MPTVSVMMKRPTCASLLALFAFLVTAGATSVGAQVAPSAYRGQFTLTAGALGSVFQPDYAGGGFAQTAPNRLYGIGTYVDAKFTRWAQIEGEARWLQFNQFVEINENNYLIGPRLPIHTFKFMRATPYVKVLVGIGRMNFEDHVAWGRYTDIAYGGGIDVKLTRRISARGDFEYQEWPSWPGIAGFANTPLYPYGVSAGIGYRIFGGTR